MECRLCRYLIVIFFIFPTSISHARCGDEEYIHWMSKLVDEKKEKIGGLALQIPTSLAVAQAAHETGYGTSFSARTRHNHFGLRPGGKYAVFSDPKEGVRMYLEHLVEKHYYRKFQDLLKKGEDNSLELLKVIAPIYAEDEEYTKRVSAMIRSCNLQRFDVANTS